jgi:EAL domain-containing protein (putative c-di-GMP-specific phosphodiesterase class I)
VQQNAVRRLLAEGGPRIVYQPQLSLSRLIVDGYEALSRFPDGPMRGAEQWFARAREFGLGDELEAAALEGALAHRQERPAGSILAVNLSPAALDSSVVTALLPDELAGIEIELTEHEWLSGTAGLRRQLDLLRERGARVAIDDVGAAHSGLRRVMDLAPDRIKIDRHLVAGVAGSTAKAALVRAVVDLAEHIGASVCAEGVENVDDLDALADLDVGYAQGWVVGLPDAGFQAADPVSITAGRDSLATMLAGRQAADSLAGLIRAFTSVIDLDGLARLADDCTGVMGCDELRVLVLSEDGAMVRALGAPGGPEGEITLDLLPLSRACLDGETVVPLYRDQAEQSHEQQLMAESGWHSALLVPVISRGRTIALLACMRTVATPWSRRHISNSRTVAAMLGPVLDVSLMTAAG